MEDFTDWLYGDGEYATYSQYNRRTKDLRQDYDKYKKRKSEYDLRQSAVEKARISLKGTLDKLEDLLVKKSWITEE